MRTVLPVSARTAILVAVLLGVAACGATDGSPSPTIAFVSPRPPASTPATDPVASGLATATTLPGAGDDRPDLASVRVTLQPVATGLSSPIVVTGAGDGSGRLFVAQQGGQVRIVEQDGTLLPTPFIDLSDRIQSGGERGLLGLAFPPGFGTGRSDLYVHDSDRNGDTTIARYTVNAADPDTADPASERIILTQAQPYANHNGGWIGFD
ncbi:MAG: PQQ-dependent sugar dehydrogenase, partial [Candidatus Limnocylindrales bacterium]